MKREQHLEDLKVREPRTEEESGLAKDLLSLVLVSRLTSQFIS